MALSTASLQTKIKGYMETYLGFSAGTTEDDKTKIRDAWDKLAHAIAQGVFEEITTNGVVTVTAVQTGVGTAPGTIS